MLFPSLLRIRAQDATGTAIPNVALVLVLKAPVKNDYYVGPLITDPDGHAQFKRSACEAAIRHAQAMFIMDYQGDLEDCGPIAQIRLHDVPALARMIDQIEAASDFWGQPFENPQKLAADLKQVDNAKFHPAAMEFISTQHSNSDPAHLTLELTRK